MISRRRMERFKSRRLSNVLSEETPVPIEPGWRSVIHIVPQSAIDSDQTFDVISMLAPAASEIRFTVDGVGQNYFDGRLFQSGRTELDGLTGTSKHFETVIERVEGPHGAGLLQQGEGGVAIHFGQP